MHLNGDGVSAYILKDILFFIFYISVSVIYVYTSYTVDWTNYLEQKNTIYNSYDIIKY